MKIFNKFSFEEADLYQFLKYQLLYKEQTGELRSQHFDLVYGFSHYITYEYATFIKFFFP